MLPDRIRHAVQIQPSRGLTLLRPLVDSRSPVWQLRCYNVEGDAQGTPQVSEGSYLYRLFAAGRNVEVQDRTKNMEEGDNLWTPQVQMEP